MPGAVALIATVAIIIAGGLHLLLNSTQDAREPPMTSNYFPFIGPMIQLSKKKTKYYVGLRYVCWLLIYFWHKKRSKCEIASLELLPDVWKQGQI